eukprot:gene5417-7346_t
MPILYGLEDRIALAPYITPATDEDGDALLKWLASQIMPGVPALALLFGLLVLCGAVTGLVIAVALTVLIPNEARGLCIGAFIAIAGLIGYGLAPWLVTLVSGWLGGESHLATALTIVGVSVSALSFLAFLLAMKRAPHNATGIPI